MLIPWIFVGTAWSYIPMRTSNGAPLHWNSQDFPLVYSLNDRTSAVLPNVTDNSEPARAVERALLTWQAVSGSKLQVAPLATTPEKGVSKTSAGWSSRIRNLITFLDTPENREFVGDNLALTNIEFNPVDGTITGTATVFNPQYTFSTNLAEGTYDVQAIAAHELGHTLGASHSAILTATMFPYADKARDAWRTLSPDDESFLGHTYPNEAAQKAYGSVQGLVLLEDQPLFGAHIVACDETNAVVISALSLPDGSFDMRGIPPGRYTLYAEPLDLPVSKDNLSSAYAPYYAAIGTSFPSTFWGGNDTPTPVDVLAGSVARISSWRIRSAPVVLNIARAGRSVDRTPKDAFVSRSPFAASPGQSFLIFLEGPGIYERIKSSDQIRILGGSVRLPPSTKPSRVLYRDETEGISFLVEVARDAVPGARTILIRDGNSLAAFTGGLEIEASSEPVYTLRFPFLSGDANNYTGIALANTSSQPATLICTAYSDTGVRFSRVGLTNPVTLILEPGSQSAVLAEQLFHFLSGSTYSGWLEIVSDNRQVTGFYLLGDRSSEYIDGADVGEKTSLQLLFPGIYQGSGWDTEISLVNPDHLLFATVTLQLYDRSGQSIGLLTRKMPPRVRLDGSVASLFGISTMDLGLITVQSDAGLIGGMLLSDSPRSDLTVRKKLAAFRAQTTEAPGTRYFIPQFPAGGGFTAQGFLSNPGAVPVTVKVSLVGENAALLGPVLERRLQPHASLSIRPEDMGLSDAAPTVAEGYLRVEVTGGPLAGGMLFQDLGGVSLADVPIQSAGITEAYFSQVAVGVYGFFTGLACVNVGDAKSPVDIIIYNETGRETARGTRTLAPGARFSELLEELTGFRGAQQGGYVRISSPSPVISFGLIGTGKTLASVPAQTPGH